LSIETNIWKGHKNKEWSVKKWRGNIKNVRFPQGKITPSIEPRNGEYFCVFLWDFEICSYFGNFYAC
jgi:hypothetical protein